MREHRQASERQICLLTGQRQEAPMCGASRRRAAPAEQQFDLIAPEDRP
jgi:hypothetical protein